VLPPVLEWRLDELYAWILASPRRLAPLPFTKSKLMTFEIPTRLVRAAMKKG